MAAGAPPPVPGPGAAKTEPSRVRSDFDLSQCRRPNSSRVRLSGGRTEIGRPSYRLRQACPSSGRQHVLRNLGRSELFQSRTVILRYEFENPFGIRLGLTADDRSGDARGLRHRRAETTPKLQQIGACSLVASPFAELARLPRADELHGRHTFAIRDLLPALRPLPPPAAWLEDRQKFEKPFFRASFAPGGRP